MNKLTRRAFGKRLVGVSVLPILNPEPLRKEFIGQAQSNEQLPNIPDAIAGYRLSEEDKRLASKFLSTHEKNMASLRERDLPNSLAPSLFFASPITNEESGDGKK